MTRSHGATAGASSSSAPAPTRQQATCTELSPIPSTYSPLELTPDPPSRTSPLPTRRQRKELQERATRMKQKRAQISATQRSIHKAEAARSAARAEKVQLMRRIWMLEDKVADLSAEHDKASRQEEEADDEYKQSLRKLNDIDRDIYASDDDSARSSRSATPIASTSQRLPPTPRSNHKGKGRARE